MGQRVALIGLDFGTTTSRAVVASADLARNAATGRTELANLTEELSSEPVFTPFVEQRIDESKLHGLLDAWLAPLGGRTVFGGGVAVTGLAAERSNAAIVARQVRDRLKDAVIAVAGDANLESWLSFMGNCGELSKAHPERLFINLDIGGGTTNVAAGRAGEVLATGSYFAAARHVEFVPGSFRLVALSRYAESLFAELHIDKQPGDELSVDEVARLADWYIELLARAVQGKLCDEPIVKLHEQAPFELPMGDRPTAITLSGGVGELVYAHLRSGTWPAATQFGDLGIELARRLVESPFWRPHLERFVPTAQGRATVYGLLRYNTQVSGSTIHLPDRGVLPLSDLMILGTVRPETTMTDLTRLLALGSRAAGGSCLRVELGSADRETVRVFADRLRTAWDAPLAPRATTLVLLLRENVGKALEGYLTDWGAKPRPIVVIDEIDARAGQFVHVGACHDGVVPVSLYGMSLEGR